MGINYNTADKVGIAPNDRSPAVLLSDRVTSQLGDLWLTNSSVVDFAKCFQVSPLTSWCLISLNFGNPNVTL